MAQTRKNDVYSQAFEAKMETSEERKGSWNELRFRYKKIEIIATGGLYNKGSKLGAQSQMARNTSLNVFSPITPEESVSWIRILKNYKKGAS